MLVRRDVFSISLFIWVVLRRSRTTPFHRSRDLRINSQEITKEEDHFLFDELISASLEFQHFGIELTPLRQLDTVISCLYFSRHIDYNLCYAPINWTIRPNLMSIGVKKHNIKRLTRLLSVDLSIESCQKLSPYFYVSSCLMFLLIKVK